MGIGFLGPLRVDGGTSLNPRARIVLSALGVRRGEVVSSDRLAEALWGETPPRSWPKQVQICVWSLRKELGADVIETVDGGYRLSTAADEIDVGRFEALLDRGRAFAATGEAERAASVLGKALELWRGRPFEDLDGWLPGRTEMARLEELRRMAEEDLLEARLAAGEHRHVVAEAEVRVAEEPLRERRWALLAVAQYRCGRQGDALRSLRRARHVLVEELGIDPGQDLVDLEQAILAHDPTLAAADAHGISPRCPYKGLAPYDIDDSDSFFGRDADVASCVDRLRGVRLLVVAGPSGCGKSSLVRAGIVPVLRRRNLAVAVVVPGADADAALSAALAASPGHPIVVVDQLEELFAAAATSAQQRTFLRRLAAYASERAPVIVTVRSDHVGNLAAEPTVARLVEQGLYLVTPLWGDALRATIEGPAATAGLRLEPGLVDLLVRETEDEPGALPLLSHALTETWERRDGRVLTVEGYRATGEIRGAVARSAERLYQSLPSEQRVKLRSLLLRLVSPAGDGEPTRTHLDKRSLGDDADRQRVLDLLVRARLVTADAASVELAHEALARAWPRLRSWLDEDAAGQRILRHLSTTANGWDGLGRPSSELYRGSRLQAALEWRTTTSPDLTDQEADFLDASRAAAASEQAALAEHARRQARQNRKLRWAVTGIATFLAMALVGGTIAVVQRQRARDQERAAALSALVGNAAALRSNRRDLAALLAVEAHRLAPSAASESALFGTFTTSPGAERIVRTGVELQTGRTDAAYLPDGQTVAVADMFGAVHLVDLASGATEEFAALSETPGLPLLEIAADGRYLAAGWRPTFETNTALLTVWDLDTGRQRFAPLTVPFGINDLAIDRDGSTVVVGGDSDARILILDAATGELRIELNPDSPPASDADAVEWVQVTFAPDGRLAVASPSGAITMVDPTTGEELQRIDGVQGTADGFIQFSPDGATIVTAQLSGYHRYNGQTGQPLWPQPTVTEQCGSSAVVERIGLVLCGESSGRVLALDLDTGVEIGRRFDSQQGAICGLAVSPDGTRFAEISSCLEGGGVTIVEWSVDGGGPISRLLVDDVQWRGPGTGPADRPLPVTSGDPWVEQFGFRGTDALVTGYPDEEGGTPITHVLDTTDGNVIAAFPGVYGLYQTDNPQIAVVIYNDWNSPETIGLYDTERHVPAGPAVDPGINADEVWTDGRLALVVSGGTQLRTIDLVAGQVVEPSFDFDSSLMGPVALDGDDFYVPAEDRSGDLRDFRIERRDLDTGEILATSGPGLDRVASGGGVVVATTVDGRVVELDDATLAVVGPPFPGTNGVVRWVLVDDAGKRLMVVGQDGTMRFYDIPTRTQLGDPISVDAGRIPTAALRDDGMAAAVPAGGGIVLWDLDPSHWEQAACRLAGRNLTRAEWDQYIGDLASYAITCPNHPAEA